MRNLPGIEQGEELKDAIEDLVNLRTDFVVNGLSLEHFHELVMAVRRVDAEIVAGVHQYRINELSPYYPESFQAEEDGYEAAEKWLRAELPEEWDL